MEIKLDFRETRTRLVCFVASAFDRKDVDAIYDRAIRPVLNKLNIRVRRVDRIEHNDDIDEQIMTLMQEADLCIADLTYARPSVYYEAGFLSGRKKPVIFIARSDHFRARDSDPEGNLRVHFDLQMKNIIGWNEPDDRFRKRLTKRIQFIIRTLSTGQRYAPRKTHTYVPLPAEVQFSAMSLANQLTATAHTSLAILRARGFKSNPETRNFREFAFHRWRNKTLDSVYFKAVPRLAGAVKDAALLARRLPDVPSSDTKKASKIISVMIIASLARFQSQTLLHGFPLYTPIGSTLLYRDDAIRQYLVNKNLRPRERVVPCRRYVAVLPQVKSIPEVKTALRAVLQELSKLERGF